MNPYPEHIVKTKQAFSRCILIFYFITGCLLFGFSAPLRATSYSSTSSISLAVSESTVFTGPGNWTMGAQLPNTTYGPTRSSANMSWKTNVTAGYALSVMISSGLTTGSATWTNHSGSVNFPTPLGVGSEAWGFSLSNVAGTAVPSKWDNGLNYAALPSGSTNVYSTGTPDTTGTSWAVYWKAQSLATTKAGTYTTTVIWTFTTDPGGGGPS